MLKRVGISILLLPLILIYLGLFTYVPVRYFHFPQEAPFSGPGLYNPYLNIDGKLALKANFHAHTRRWLGLTYGNTSKEDLYELYRRLGYHVIGISDYMSINRKFYDSSGFIPMYEHGINLRKTHQLVIGAKSVSLSEQPFFQGIHQKQHNLFGIRDEGSLIALAHPGRLHGYKEHELRKLTGFELFEVFNQHRRYERLWDIVLSSGKPVFAIANDDFHIMRPRDFARALTIVFSTEISRQAVLSALRNGSHYVVRLPHNDQMTLDDKIAAVQSIPKMQNFTLSNDTLFVSFNREASEIRFIGQEGTTVHSITQSKEAKYIIAETDHYIRVAAMFDQGYEILLNPVFRYDPQEPKHKTARVNKPKTILLQSLILLTLLTPLFVVLRWQLRRRRSNAAKRNI